MEEKSKSLTLKSLNGLGDTVPETFPSLGEVTISLVDEMSDVIISKTNCYYNWDRNDQTFFMTEAKVKGDGFKGQ